MKEIGNVTLALAPLVCFASLKEPLGLVYGLVLDRARWNRCWERLLLTVVVQMD